METAFTPLVSLTGGLMIGAAAVLLMATLGRILGATGILGGLVLPEGRADFGWRATLVAGMVTAPILLAVIGRPVAIDVPVSLPMLIGGGLLVGFGAAMGSGCTSGHGVCGMSRLSARSIVATLTFMATSAVTVFAIRHLIGA
ncbi:YeeE/YedE family protein [Roseobacter sp. HKCCA0434]|uniref:YeeE/YedE family protein n=1 Tax=Roseobacter sp. HKCCA0434 TaxID=3079297 RepID=UPI0029058C23|nr:YeeE/YedE thiosulfate transporter family protein [Roseobacter sp. HKCCA0434]